MLDKSANPAERLDVAPIVVAVREALGSADGVWVVGGAVRDAALGREVADLDLAVAGDPGATAKAIGRGLGEHAFELSAEFGTWRVVSPARGWQIDVTVLRGETIEADLAERDFTIGAVAVPLAGGEPIDPYAGLTDLAERRLRAVGEKSFTGDPLRLLRAPRLAAELDLEIDERTVALARAAADRAGEPAGERQLAELRQLVGGPDPLRGISLLGELGITPVVLPELETLRGVEQGPNHHLDVHGHTLAVFERTIEVEGNLDRFAGERAADARALLDEPLADEMSRRTALRFGALLHDIGKPATHAVLPNGRVTFMGHDKLGEEMVGALARRLRASERFARYVGGLTRHHLTLGFLVHEQPLDRGKVYRYLRRTAPVEVEVTVLSCADRLATQGRRGEEATRAHLELARELMPAVLDWREQGPPRVPVRGDELARELAIEPGPELGRLLAELEEAAYAGEASTREQAIALARRLRA
jgi:poly(A) polymerase